MVTVSFGVERTSRGLKLMGVTCPQYENETDKLERTQRIAVKTTKCLKNASCSEIFKELNLFSLSEGSIRDYFNTICKYLYRNKNLVIESSLSDKNIPRCNDGEQKQDNSD